MSQAFAFSVLLSCMRIAEARVEIASAILLVEINMTQCFSLVAAGIICVFIMCWSPRRRVGACEESQKEKPEVENDEKIENDFGPVNVDDSACRVKGCASSKPEGLRSCFLHDLCVKFQSNESCYGHHDARVSLRH